MVVVVNYLVVELGGWNSNDSSRSEGGGMPVGGWCWSINNNVVGNDEVW